MPPGPTLFRFTIGALLLAIAVGLSVVVRAETACPQDPKLALAMSRDALASSGERDFATTQRIALLCLIEVVAALDARIQGLSDGTIPFDGQIHIPKGYVMMRPPAEEAR